MPIKLSAPGGECWRSLVGMTMANSTTYPTPTIHEYPLPLRPIMICLFLHNDAVGTKIGKGEGRVGWIADLWVGMYRRGYSIGILVGGRRKVLSPSQCPIKHGNLLSLSFCPWDYAEYVLESTRVLCSSSRDNHNHTTTVGRSVSWSPTIIIIVRWDVHYYPIRAKVVGFCSRETGEDGKWANRRSIRTIGES